MKFEFNLTEEAKELFLHIAKEGYAEYRDTEFPTVDHFIAPENVTHRGRPIDSAGIASFLSRNSGGTYHLIDQLLGYGLVESESEAWHSTYKLSSLGQLVLIYNGIDYKTI